MVFCVYADLTGFVFLSLSGYKNGSVTRERIRDEVKWLKYVVFNDANGTLGPIFTAKKTTQFLNGTS